MSKPFVSTDSFLATATPVERKIITDAEDRLRAELSLGSGAHKTCELPSKWGEEAITMYRWGLVSAQNLQSVLDWVLRNPEKVKSIANVVSMQGARQMHERGDPQGELDKLSANHAQWRQKYAVDPTQAINDATRAVMVSSRGLCNPAEIKTAGAGFFSDSTPEASPGHPENA